MFHDPIGEILSEDFRNWFEKIMLSLQDIGKISILKNTLTKTRTTKNRITWV